MPPRIPAVGVFVACYLAAAAGGGAEAVFRVVTLWDPEIARAVFGWFGWGEGERAEIAEALRAAHGGAEPTATGAWLAETWGRLWTGRLWLSLGEVLALAAAVCALPDAAWRPARRRADMAASGVVAAGVVAAFAANPALLTASSAVLAAIAWGDFLSSCGRSARATAL